MCSTSSRSVTRRSPPHSNTPDGATGAIDQRPVVTVQPNADYGYHLNDPNLALGGRRVLLDARTPLNRRIRAAGVGE